MDAPIKFWSPLQVAVAAFFGGPMAGCYFLGRNYKATNQGDKARNCYIAGVLISILLPIVFAFTPEVVPLAVGTSLAISVITTIGMVAYKHQKPLIKHYMAEGAKRYSAGWCILMIFSIAITMQPLAILTGFMVGYFTA